MRKSLGCDPYIRCSLVPYASTGRHGAYTGRTCVSTGLFLFLSASFPHFPSLRALILSILLRSTGSLRIFRTHGASRTIARVSIFFFSLSLIPLSRCHRSALLYSLPGRKACCNLLRLFYHRHCHRGRIESTACLRVSFETARRGSYSCHPRRRL